MQFDEAHIQAKLVVVSPELAQELVPNISRFANSQNKVNEADFFSNSPFHVRLEELSRRILTPPRPGVTYQSKWFYERARGQYANEKAKLGKLGGGEEVHRDVPAHPGHHEDRCRQVRGVVGPQATPCQRWGSEELRSICQ